MLGVMINPAQKKQLLFALCIFLFSVPVFAQNSEREDLWICPGAEIARFSVGSASFGGGLAFGYGSGISIGLKAAYFVDFDGDVSSMEFNLLLRLYFGGSGSCSGLFIQFNGGPVLFAQEKSMGIPAEKGTVSAGLSLGWRFLLGSHLFIEPSLRAGYPYIIGAGLYAGFRF